MKKILAAIFGSSKNTETIVDGAVSGLDKMFFTEEEKAEANQKLSEWYLTYLAATQPQNLARRLIALVIVWLWWVLVALGVIVRGIELWILGVVESEALYSEFIFNVLVEVVMQPFSIVIGFYFLTHVVRTYEREKKN